VTVVVMKVGVPEGSPLSPSIFNLYIDKLAQRLDRVSHRIANIPATIYADDVVIFAKSAKGLRRLLEICTKWAEKYGMTWATEPGKSSVLVPKRATSQFYLAGEIIGRVEKTNYLGMIVSFKGVVSADSRSRHKAVRERCDHLKLVGLLKRAHMARIIATYNILYAQCMSIEARWRSGTRDWKRTLLKQRSDL